MARIQKQVAIALPPDRRERLEKAAEVAGNSVSEEIRRRLARSFLEEETHLRRLQEDVAKFAKAVEKQTAHDWTKIQALRAPLWRP
jgi:predicted DNA-binding protein